MSRKMTTRRPAASTPTVNSVCYCNGQRTPDKLELYCANCNKWFHGSCLRDLPDFYGLNFMVCYVFHCHDCSPTKKETWSPKNANFNHMCVTVLANLTLQYILKKNMDPTERLSSHTFFNLNNTIIPYIDEQWNLLTSMQKRVKNTWHATIHKTLSKETNLFKVDPADDKSFALVELDLTMIGPAHEGVKLIGKKTSATSNLTTTLVDQKKIERLTSEEAEAGPKTRGATKRKTVDASVPPSNVKKSKSSVDCSSVRMGGNQLDVPFNKDGYRYLITELDPHVKERVVKVEEENEKIVIMGCTHRIATQEIVTISPNDRAYQLRLSEDRLTITGHDGYRVARATHSVRAGTWYYEVIYQRSVKDSAIRIGWAQQHAAVQACVGYNKFSYGWRSLHGTKFHDAIGKSYCPGGFKEGDVLGCLIFMPYSITDPRIIPDSGKDHNLVNFKKHMFYEEHEESQSVLKTLTPLRGSRIEFFRNGVACGVAYMDIYDGFYFPAVSLYGEATIRVNFGPRFRHRPPKGVRAMSERAEELHVHQSMADMLYIIENRLPTST